MSDLKPFKCPDCPARFTRKVNRKNHVIVVHKNAGRFECAKCPKTFAQKCHLVKHERSHTGERPFECPVCKKKFARDSHKRNHVIVMHENAGRWRCSHCQKTFQERHVWETHERTHTGEKPFECPYCQQKFTSQNCKKNHVLVVHQNAGRLRCDYCPKTFQNKYAKEVHKRVHSGERPFRCELCQMDFKFKCNLKRHQVDIHSEKKFACDQCDKSFGQSYDLKQHQRTHSAGASFKCNLCESSYKYLCGLRRHRKKVHSTTQRETTEERLSIRGEDQNEMVKVEPDDEASSAGAAYCLRARRQTPSYRPDEETDESDESGSLWGSDSEAWDSDEDEEDKPSESGEESGQEEAERFDGVLNEEEEQNDGRIGGMPSKRVKTENSALSEIDSVSSFDAPINVSQQTIKKESIKREPDSGDQISNDVDMANELKNPNASLVITLSSDEESDQVDDELPLRWSTFSANLKLVYDVEYRAPE